MMIRRISLVTAAAVLLISLGSGRANASVLGTANVYFNGFLTVTNYDASYLNGVNETNNLGTYKLAFNSPTGLYTSLTSPIVGMCIEVDQSGDTTPAPYDMVDMEDVLTHAQSNLIREMWGRFFDPAWNTSGNGFTANYTAMLFNIALHEIAYDYNGTPASLDVTAGTLTIGAGLTAVQASDYTTINNWYSQLTGDHQYFANLVILHNPTKQDFLTQLPGSFVPEPAAAALTAIGGMLIFRRRRRIA
jgi:hypothetical protein